MGDGLCKISVHCINSLESVCCVPAGYTQILYWLFYYPQILKQVLISPIHLLFPLRLEFSESFKSAKVIPATRTQDSATCTITFPWCWHRVYGAVWWGDQKNCCVYSWLEFPTNWQYKGPRMSNRGKKTLGLAVAGSRIHHCGLSLHLMHLSDVLSGLVYGKIRMFVEAVFSNL